MTEINLNFYDEAVKEYKRLLANKDKLVKQESADGRNQFQIKINDLRKSIKGQDFKFKDFMNDTLKQEGEGKFDRGAEGKKKNKLRKKMVGKPKKEFTKGRHKDSDVDKVFVKDLKPMDRDVMVSEIVAMTGTKKKPKTGPKAGSR